MPETTLEIAIAGPVATIWMNRAAAHNALNELMIEELTGAFQSLGAEDAVRVIVLSGRGKSFSAGADIGSMREQGSAPAVANLESARKLGAMFGAIAQSPKPTIARVNGAAFGGGLGLVAACDIAVAAASAVFAASEVRLGLIPATIGPYVIGAMGARNARRLFLTGERFDAAHAHRIDLVHETVEPEELDSHVGAVIENLLAGAPLAQKAAKELIDAVANQPITSELLEDTAVRIARIRTEAEAQEGLSAFLEKRAASWVAR